MAKGKILSDIEKGKIIAFKEQNLSNREIARRLGCSKDSINNFFKKGENYGKRKRYGRKEKLTTRTKRRILKVFKNLIEVMNFLKDMSNSMIGCRAIKKELSLDVSHQTIWRVAKSDPNIVRQKLRTRPHLTPTHKEARVKFAEERIWWRKKWNSVKYGSIYLAIFLVKVIFSDEKKWNLDGPDGWNCYWRDLRKEPRVFSKRGFGGGSVMTWAAISSLGRVSLVFVEGRMDSKKYQNVLEDGLLPFLRRFPHLQFIYQQDNAAIHVSRSTKDWMELKNITTMEWPARSPDINCIENLWGILARKVYEDGKHFNNKRELEIAIGTAWDELPQDIFKNLYQSMPKRMIDVLKRKGEVTKY